MLHYIRFQTNSHDTLAAPVRILHSALTILTIVMALCHEKSCFDQHTADFLGTEASMVPQERCDWTMRLKRPSDTESSIAKGDGLVLAVHRNKRGAWGSCPNESEYTVRCSKSCKSLTVQLPQLTSPHHTWNYIAPSLELIEPIRIEPALGHVYTDVLHARRGQRRIHHGRRIVAEHHNILAVGPIRLQTHTHVTPKGGFFSRTAPGSAAARGKVWSR